MRDQTGPGRLWIKPSPGEPMRQIGCIFRRNSGRIPYILVLSCCTQQNYVSLCHQKTEKEQKLRQRNVVFTNTIADLHTYFLRRSVLKFTFLLKNNKHISTRTNDTRCWIFVCVRTAPPRGTGRGRGVCVCLCVRMWWGGAKLYGHMLPTRIPHTVPPPFSLPQ